MRRVVYTEEVRRKVRIQTVAIVIAALAGPPVACSLEQGGLTGLVDGGRDSSVDSFTPIDAADSSDEMPTDTSIADTNTAPLSPDQVTGLEFWVRSDSVVTDDGGLVLSWNDKSGKGDPNRNAVSTAGTEPSRLPSSPYGAPALSFFPSDSGAQGQWLRTGIWSAAVVQPFSLLVVGEGTSYFVDSISGAKQAAILSVGGQARLFANAYVSGGGPSVGKREIIGVFNGASSELYNNQFSATASGDPGPNGFSGLTIGNTAGPSPAFTLRGYLVEVAVWSRTLTPSEISGLNKYGAARYGLTIAP